MDKPRKPKSGVAKGIPGEARPEGARPYLGGGGGRLPTGEGPRVVGTDEAMPQVQEHPEDLPGQSPDMERSPGRGGWHF